MMRVLGLNNPEWKYNILGSISAILVGASLPLFAIIFGEFYGVNDRVTSESLQLIFLLTVNVTAR